MRILATAVGVVLLSVSAWAQQAAATGGTIVEPTRNGMNVTGKAIEGGARQKLAKGDFLIVPAGVPHMFADISPAGITVMQLYLAKAK